MPMGAAAYVSANFLHKKERVACTLLKVLMRYYAKQGTPIGCLHPFNPAFYANMGYGYCNENYLYQPKPSAIRSYGDKSGLSYARPETGRRFWTSTAPMRRVPTVPRSTTIWTPTGSSTCPTWWSAAGTAGSPATSPSISWRWTTTRHVPRSARPRDGV